MKSELIVQKSNSGKYQKIMLQFLNFSVCILLSLITHSLLSQFLLSKFHSENNFQGNVNQMAFSNLPQEKKNAK